MPDTRTKDRRGMSEIIIRATFKGQSGCLICGKAMDHHSFDEANACVAAEKSRIAHDPCPSCGRRSVSTQMWTIERVRRSKTTSKGASSRKRTSLSQLAIIPITLKTVGTLALPNRVSTQDLLQVESHVLICADQNANRLTVPIVCDRWHIEDWN
jgi:hypothetical protein